jgi:hypothetical protein
MPKAINAPVAVAMAIAAAIVPISFLAAGALRGGDAGNWEVLAMGGDGTADKAALGQSAIVDNLYKKVGNL